MDILKAIDLIGLKMPYKDEFCSYFETLPVGFVKCDEFMDFYRIIKGRKKLIKENLEPKYEMEYLIYSPDTKLYYYKIVRKYTNMTTILNYYHDGNIYIRSAEYTKKEEPVKKTPLKDEDDYILY